jgi:hypothetical protein
MSVNRSATNYPIANEKVVNATRPPINWPRARPACSRLRLTFETLVCGLFRDGVQFCSGLVDLVVCLRRDGCGGHCFTLSGKRLIGPVAEDLA